MPTIDTYRPQCLSGKTLATMASNGRSAREIPQLAPTTDPFRRCSIVDLRSYGHKSPKSKALPGKCVARAYDEGETLMSNHPSHVIALGKKIVVLFEFNKERRNIRQNIRAMTRGI